ncbi:CapA family protein [Nodosilinea sp. P-1105]|uniref:CapA family protein n=1 Tax=Nodosilinea sp. P-1105 TaxID=2546229 RepID=UPI001980B451
MDRSFQPQVNPSEAFRQRADLQRQAKAGDVRAIAQLLSATLGDSSLDLEVSRRHHILYVFLTTADLDAPEIYGRIIYGEIVALNLAGIRQLQVVDGRNQPFPQRWQQVFALTPGADRPLNPPVDTAVIDVAAPSPPPPPASVPVAPSTARRRWRRWIILPATIALGFGLGAGVTQWRYAQQSAQVETSVDAPEAIVADTDRPLGDDLPPEQLTQENASPPDTPPFMPMLSTDQAAALIPSSLEAPPRITVKAVGDIIPGTDYQTYRLPQDWRYLFRSIQYHLGDADIVFGNFESTLTDVPRSAKDTSRPMTFAFRTPPWYASVLKVAGFNVLSVANNHSFDFFEQGFEDTVAHIEAEGMKAVGRKGDITLMQVQGITVAVIGFSTLSHHNTVHDLDTAIHLVQTAQQQADLVIVSFHAGKEGTDAIYTRNETEFFHGENRGNVVQFSRTVVDHGADLVLGHGPHVPRAIELYNDKLIAYSLGNFLGYRTLSTQGPLGVSLILEVHLNAQGDFVNGRIIPVALDRNGVPYLDDHFQGVVLVRHFTQRDFPDTPLRIDDLGYIWPSDSGE